MFYDFVIYKIELYNFLTSGTNISKFQKFLL